MAIGKRCHRAESRFGCAICSCVDGVKLKPAAGRVMRQDLDDFRIGGGDLPMAAAVFFEGLGLGVRIGRMYEGLVGIASWPGRSMTRPCNPVRAGARPSRAAKCRRACCTNAALAVEASVDEQWMGYGVRRTTVGIQCSTNICMPLPQTVPRGEQVACSIAARSGKSIRRCRLMVAAGACGRSELRGRLPRAAPWWRLPRRNSLLVKCPCEKFAPLEDLISLWGGLVNGAAVLVKFEMLLVQADLNPLAAERTRAGGFGVNVAIGLEGLVAFFVDPQN